MSFQWHTDPEQMIIDLKKKIERQAKRIAELERGRDIQKRLHEAAQEMRDRYSSCGTDVSIIRNVGLAKCDEIERLEAQCEALQNKCAVRGLSPEDSDALEAENERLRAVYEAAKALAKEVDAWAEDAGGYTPAWFDLEAALKEDKDHE